MLLALGLKGAKPNLKARLNVKRRDGLLLAVFYAVVGIAQLVILALSNFALVTSGILAVLSLIAAYGLFTVKKWSVWLVIGLFFPQFVFGAVTLYASILRYTTYQEMNLLLLNIALAIFIVLSFVSFVYVAAKRKSFQ
jgi:uncharacterized membrane protein (DUF2068 family)